eukprot:5910544-Prymnesium_polylepis.1
MPVYEQWSKAPCGCSKHRVSSAPRVARSDPVIKMELSGPDAIKAWRKLLGPTNSAKVARTAANRSHAHRDAPTTSGLGESTQYTEIRRLPTRQAREEAPESVRAKFGTDGQRNAGHGSDSPESAARELALMFKGAGFPKM